jgi:hypothetical protein
LKQEAPGRKEAEGILLPRFIQDPSVQDPSVTVDRNDSRSQLLALVTIFLAPKTAMGERLRRKRKLERSGQAEATICREVRSVSYTTIHLLEASEPKLRRHFASRG